METKTRGAAAKMHKSRKNTGVFRFFLPGVAFTSRGKSAGLQTVSECFPLAPFAPLCGHPNCGIWDEVELGRRHLFDAQSQHGTLSSPNVEW
jgi:hypothetical protein